MYLKMFPLALLALVGCATESSRATAPSVQASAASSVPTMSTVPANNTLAVQRLPAPYVVPASGKPTPNVADVDLRGFAGPTDNAELFGYDENSNRLFFYSGGAISLPLRLSDDGDYHIIIIASCDEAKGELAKFIVNIDGQVVGEETACTTTEATEYVMEGHGLQAGEHKITIEFLNDVYKKNEYDLNLYIHGVTLRPAP